MSLRDRLNVEELLVALDIAVVRRRGNKLYAKCPSPDHQDLEPSWSIVDDPGSYKHGGSWCFSCKFGGGPWELVQAVRGVDAEEAAAFVGALVSGKSRGVASVPAVVVRVPPSVPRRYFLPPQVKIPARDGSVWPAPFLAYLDARGVTAEQRERYAFGFALRGSLAWRVVIPVYTRGRLVAHVARAIFEDGSERYDMPRTSTGASPASAVLGEPWLNPELGVLTIAEGSFSMLALERAGAPNPVALVGSDWSISRVAILTRHPWHTVIVATDPDLAGERVAAAISVSFRRANVLRMKLARSPDDLQSDEARAAVVEALERAACVTAASSK